MLTNFYKSVATMQSNCTGMIKLINCYVLMKENFSVKLQNQLQLSKDQFSVYKEYLNALSQKMTLKDCISINLIKTLEEKTRKAVGQNLENLLVAYNKYAVKLDYLSRILPFDYAAAKSQLKSLFETYKTRDMTLYSILKDNLIYEIRESLVKFDVGLRAFLDKALLKHLMPRIDSLVSWLTPNFAIFGIIDLAGDEDPEDYSVDTAYYNDLIKAIGTFENEFIAKYSLTPVTTRTYVPPEVVVTPSKPKVDTFKRNERYERNLNEIAIESNPSESDVETPARANERIAPLCSAEEDHKVASANFGVNISDDEKITQSKKHKKVKPSSVAFELPPSSGTKPQSPVSTRKKTGAKGGR